MKEPEQTPLFDVTEYSPQGEEWHDMPEYRHEDMTPWRSLIVHFESAEDLRAFGELVGQKIGPGLRSIWFPEAEIGRYSDKRYRSES